MILSEYELIKTERKLAKYMGVIVSESNPDYVMHANLFNHKPMVISSHDPI